MRSSDIKKRLVDEANKIDIPALGPGFLDKVERQVILRDSKRVNMKRFILTPVLVLSLLAVVLVLSLHDWSKVTPSNKISDVKKAYAMQSVMLATVADSFDVVAPLSNFAFLKSKDDEENTNYLQVAKDIKKYYELINDVAFKDSIEITIEESSNPDYEYAMKITKTRENFTYYWYYTETKLTKDKDDDDDDDIDEVNSIIEGIICYNDKIFKVMGGKNIDGKEYEIEMKVILSSTRYVSVSQQSETKETEFTFEYYDNGELTEEMSIEVETKQNKKVYKLEEKKDNIENQYTFEIKKKIECNVDSDIYEGKVEMEFIDQEIKFIFEDGTTINLKK